MTDLSGVNAIVTGSTRGLGLAVAESMLAAGARVVVNGRTEQACRAALEQLGGEGDHLTYVAGGVDQESTADALMSRCEHAFGPVTAVVNNAGITRDKSLIKMSVNDFDDVIAVNLRGTWLVARAAARSMSAAGGTIINVTSGSALFGLVGQSNYAAAKGGVNALTRALSLELARYRISVNALYPIARTDMTAPVLKMTGAEHSPLQAVFGSSDHVARVVMGLADPLCPPITGQIFSFDGSTLALWSHPDRGYSVRHEPPWTDAALASALRHLSDEPEMLKPDAVGAKTRAALRAAKT